MRVFKYIAGFLTVALLISCGTDSNPTTYNVQVSASPAEGGTVSPAADSTYEEGQPITLTAKPAEGYEFTKWSGSIDTTANPLSITVDQNLSLVANFAKKSYELTVNTEGEGTVTEQVLETKSKKYEHGTVVELMANPAEGWQFVEWKGDLSGSENPAQITVDQAKEVTAVFEKKSYELTVNTDGEGAVDEEVVQTKSTEYYHGTIVKLTANAAEGWQFVEWQGDLSGSDNPEQITVDAPKDVTAVFKKQSYKLTVNTDGEGTVAKDPDQTTYESFTTVELTATPAEGWKFKKWKGDITSTDNQFQIMMDEPKQVTAVFEKKNYELTVNTEGEGAVNRDPDQKEYAYNTTVTLEAVPASGWHFVEWNGDISSTDTTVQVTMDQAKQVTAVFEQEEDRLYTLDVQIEGAGTFRTELLTGTKQDSAYTFGSKVRIFFDIDDGHYLDRLGGDLDINYGTPRFGTFKKNVVLEDDMTVIGIIKEIPFAGGSGTETDPYQVATLNQLDAIHKFINVGNHYTQIADIDAGATAGWNEGKGFKPITGKKVTYDGQRHTISDLVIKYNGTRYIGLFGVENSDSEFRNVNLENILVNSTGRLGRFHARYTGSIAGKGKAYNIKVTGTIKGGGSVGGIIGTGSVENSEADVEVTGQRKNRGALVGKGDVINSAAAGKVSGSEFVGGLVGTGTVKNSHSSVSVSGEHFVGGLIGYGSSSNSHATGNVSGKESTGGLIGYGSSSNSYATGNVSGKESTGGLIGELGTKISHSYATGTVDGTQNTGGLVGLVSEDGSVSATADIIEASYASGNVSGSNNVGGLIGKATNISLKNSYAHGDVDGQENVGGVIGSLTEYEDVLYSYSTGKVTGNSNVGGFLGSATDLRDSGFNDNYWNTSTSEQSDGVGNKQDFGVDGLTTNQMSGDNAEENMPEFDFMNIWITTDDYPILRWQKQ